MSQPRVSEEDLRDRLVSIVETIGSGGRLDDEELRHVGREAFQMASDSKKLRQKREDEVGE